MRRIQTVKNLKELSVKNVTKVIIYKIRNASKQIPSAKHFTRKTDFVVLVSLVILFWMVIVKRDSKEIHNVKHFQHPILTFVRSATKGTWRSMEPASNKILFVKLLLKVMVTVKAVGKASV